MKRRRVTIAAAIVAVAVSIAVFITGNSPKATPTTSWNDFIEDQYGTYYEDWYAGLWKITASGMILIGADTTGDIGQYTIANVPSGFYQIRCYGLAFDATDDPDSAVSYQEVVINVPLSGKVLVGDTLWVGHIVIDSSITYWKALIDSVMYADSAGYGDSAGYADQALVAAVADSAVIAGWSYLGAWADSSDNAEFAWLAADADTATYAWNAENADTASNADNFNIDDSCYVGRHLVVGDSAWIDKLISIADDQGELRLGLKIRHSGDPDTWISFGNMTTDTDEFNVRCGNIDFLNIDQAAKSWHAFLDNDLDFLVSNFWAGAGSDTVFFIRNAYPCDEDLRGNIGIRTTDPQHALHVSGDVGIDDTLHIGPGYDWQLHVVDSTLQLENSAGDTAVTFWPDMSWWQGPMMLVNADTNDIQTWKGSGAPLQMWIEGGIGVHGDFRWYREDGTRGASLGDDTTLTIIQTANDARNIYSDLAGHNPINLDIQTQIETTGDGFGIKSVLQSNLVANDTGYAIYGAALDNAPTPPDARLAVGYGVYGWADNSNVSIGVYGKATNSDFAWAGYFADGDVFAENDIWADTAHAALKGTASDWAEKDTKADVNPGMFQQLWCWSFWPGMGGVSVDHIFGTSTAPLFAPHDTVEVQWVRMVMELSAIDAVWDFALTSKDGADTLVFMDSLHTTAAAVCSAWTVSDTLTPADGYIFDWNEKSGTVAARCLDLQILYLVLNP